jgi:F-type H+-transporting ATPase subunit b
MDINITLFGEMLTFAVLVWFTMKYVWPPITKTMQERQQKIANGLAAAERGQEDLKLAQKEVLVQLNEAKTKAVSMLEQASLRANNLIEESRLKAQNESETMLIQAKADIAQEINKTKVELQQQTINLVIAATEKLLQQQVDDATQQKLTNQIITEL